MTLTVKKTLFPLNFTMSFGSTGGCRTCSVQLAANMTPKQVIGTINLTSSNLKGRTNCARAWGGDNGE